VLKIKEDVMAFNRKLIDRFAAGADVPARAIKGLTRKELHTLPPGAPGLWTIHQIMVHLMDSHVVMGTRVKRIVAEDKPLITAYDESKWTANLHYETVDTAQACEMFRLNQRMIADLLKQLPDQAFNREGVHTERGLIKLGPMVQGYIEHLDHHMKFVRAKRKLLGKPLKA
jgi:hypothetical protein